MEELLSPMPPDGALAVDKEPVAEAALAVPLAVPLILALALSEEVASEGTVSAVPDELVLLEELLEEDRV